MKRLFAYCLAALTACSCSDTISTDARGGRAFAAGPHGNTYIVLATGDFTKSESPDENLISDVNIFIFNKDGLLEQKLYLTGEELMPASGGAGTVVSLLKGCEYSVYACANTGFPMPCGNLQELLRYRFYMAYPDDYRRGVAMSGHLGGFTVRDGGGIVVPMTRTMAKISLAIDRSALAGDVEFVVRKVELCGCPKSVLMFGDSAAESSDDTFNVGFMRSDSGADALNRNRTGQRSGETSLYMFENMQGRPLGEIDRWEDKVFDENDPLETKCSYIELTADYISPEYYSQGGKGLVYRMYLGEGPAGFDVERNCHYHVTVRPEGDGLPDCRWRVDKSGLTYRGETYLRVAPSGYLHGHPGDRIHIRCDYKPDFAPFDIGLEYLEFDKGNGIYDYRIDEDGKGFELELKGTGSGLIYIEAGEPIDDAELIFLVVDPPGVGDT